MKLKLAKPAFDIGLFTRQKDEIIAFWRSCIALDFDHILPISKSVRQHRFKFGHGILKINDVRDKLDIGAPSSLRNVTIALPGCTSIKALKDPDGNEIILCPPGYRGVIHWALTVFAPSSNAFFGFYVDILGLPKLKDHADAVTCGDSMLIFDRGVADRPVSMDAALQQTGLRYFTLQVFDVDDVYARVTRAGGLGAIPPMTLGETARIAFVRDPGGNWIELSQRASLTGPLSR